MDKRSTVCRVLILAGGVDYICNIIYLSLTKETINVENHPYQDFAERVHKEAPLQRFGVGDDGPLTNRVNVDSLGANCVNSLTGLEI